MEIAATILNQLGGKMFLLMTGAKNLSASKTALNMTLTTNKAKAKYLNIELKGDDTYTLTFKKGQNKNFEFPIVATFESIYCDQLQEIFTKVTGLYTKL